MGIIDAPAPEIRFKNQLSLIADKQTIGAVLRFFGPFGDLPGKGEDLFGVTTVGAEFSNWNSIIQFRSRRLTFTIGTLSRNHQLYWTGAQKKGNHSTSPRVFAYGNA